MTTRPHQNPEDGYAIRISKNLPKNAANLSYVHVDKPTPSKNINLKDYTGNIQENKPSQSDEIIEAYLNDDGLLEVDQDLFKSKNPNLLVTNEYANDLDQTPLFYEYKSKYPLNAENIEVSIPLSGGRLSAPRYLHDYTDGEESRFIYEGEKVRIVRTENQPLERDDIFKVALEKEGNDYFVKVYAARELLDSGYEIHYPSVQESGVVNQKEIINLTPIFREETQVRDYLSTNNFQVVENEDNTFSIQVDKEAGNFLITEEEREPYTFEYQLASKVKTRLGEKNPLKVNIGIMYINENVFNAVQTTAAMKKIVYDNPLIPDYLTFDNPHRRSEGIHEKTNSEYWEASITMPMEHWLDYDVLILSGYGSYDFGRMNQNVRNFLDIGGILLVETAGEGGDILQLDNNYITTVRYSNTQVEEGARQLTSQEVKDRYYDVQHTEEVGRIAPVIEFMGQENEQDWETFVRYENGGPALMRKKTEPTGQLLYSNMGLMQDILFNNREAMRFFINLLIVLLEERSFITPVYSEFVYHKDDLYREEYTDKVGKTLYYNDKSDEDSTQIVAKKILSDNINDVVVPHLPEAYRNWESIDIQTNLFDKERITIQNNQFNMAGEEEEFKETTANAIPGFRYISYEGTQGTGYHVSAPTQGEPSHIQVETTNTQAFFEQEIGRLTPGFYQLDIRAAVTSTEEGGVAIYDVRGEPLASLEITGTSGWRNYQLPFEITETQTVYLRLGAYGETSHANLRFSEVHLHSQGLVRITPDNAGATTLYAYAISPKGKNNQLVAYEQTYSQPTILKENIELQTTLRVRSFVYRWFSEEARFRKEYGNEKETKVRINSRDKEVILGNILEFIPALYSGVEWSRKQNVFYELSLEDDTFVNLSMYDPTIDRFFFTPNGEWVISHEDIWWNGFESTIQVKLHTNFYHLLATNNQFSVAYAPNKEFKVYLPYTEDERDRWHLRVQKGAFSKTTVNASELEELKELGKEHQYDEFLIGEHLYDLPEYNQQTFYPYFGEKMLDEEKAVYVNPYKIEVQSTPLVIKEVSVNKERLTPNSDATIWSSQNIFWESTELPQVYIDQNNTGEPVLLTRGYQIDYQEGKIILNESTDGTIYASYRHDNFKIYKRDFRNKNISNELLVTRDGHTFQMSQPNITVMPAPKFYLGTPSPDTLVHPSRYWIDYTAGTVTFFEHIAGRVYGTYSYFTEEELEYADVNKNTGEIYLKDRISFRDEIYVTYLAEEHTLEYKGYYDEDLRRFIQLDLNPTAGHSFDYVSERSKEPLSSSRNVVQNGATYTLAISEDVLEQGESGELLTDHLEIRGQARDPRSEEKQEAAGYFVVYEQPAETFSVDEYTELSLDNQEEADKYYVLSDEEYPYIESYRSEEAETAVAYDVQSLPLNIRVDWYQDEDLEYLLDTQTIPVIAEGTREEALRQLQIPKPETTIQVEHLEGTELLDKEIYIYLLPHRSTYYKKEVQNKQTIKHVFHEKEWQRIKEAHPEALLLAQVQVRENTNKENIVMMDARRPGGGLKESVKEADIEKRLGYTNSFWDIGSFDGLAYYKNGVLVLQVPEKVLAVNGGHFTEDGVRKIVDKYMAYGVYPIIEFTKER